MEGTPSSGMAGILVELVVDVDSDASPVMKSNLSPRSACSELVARAKLVSVVKL